MQAAPTAAYLCSPMTSAVVCCQAEEVPAATLSNGMAMDRCRNRECSMETVRLTKARAAAGAFSNLMRPSLNLDWIVDVLVL